MAITTTVSIRNGANVNIPSTYVPTALPTLADPQILNDTAIIACSAADNAVLATTLSNIVTQLTTYLNTTYYPDVLKLDATKTITVSIDIYLIVRGRTTNDLITGTENFYLTFIAKWQ